MTTLSSPRVEYKAIFGSPTAMNNDLAKQGLVVSGPHQVVYLRCCEAMAAWEFVAFPLGAVASPSDAKLKALNTKTMREVKAHMGSAHPGDAARGVVVPIARGPRKSLAKLRSTPVVPAVSVQVTVSSTSPGPVAAIVVHQGQKRARDDQISASPASRIPKQARTEPQVTVELKSAESDNADVDVSLEECWNSVLSTVPSLELHDDNLTDDESAVLHQLFAALLAAMQGRSRDSWSEAERRQFRSEQVVAALKRASGLVTTAMQTGTRGGKNVGGMRARELRNQAGKSVCAVLAHIFGEFNFDAFHFRPLWREAIDLAAEVCRTFCSRFCNCEYCALDATAKYDALRIEACLARYPSMREYVLSQGIIELENESDSESS